MAKLRDASVGDVVYLNVNGTPTAFTVVHQGLPSDTYDPSCNGTWVLAKDIYTTRVFDSGADNDYGTSEIKAWLESEFFNSLDAEVRNNVQNVKLPYIKNGISMTGSSGIPSTVFLLSGGEVSSTQLDYTVGSRLAYFTSDSKASRIAYYNGTATIYFLRNPGREADPDRTQCVDTGGSTYAQRLVASPFGIRPAMILSPSLFVDATGNLREVNLGGYAIIGGEHKELDSGYVKVDGEWKSIIGAFKNIDGTVRE